MNTAPVIQRLTSMLTGWAQVAGAAEVAAAESGLVTPPAAFVLPIDEVGQPNRTMGRHTQRVSCGFAVVVVVSSLRDAAGGDASADELHTRRMAVRQALLGWAPEPDVGFACEFSRGQLLRFEGQLVWWSDEYTVDTYYTATPA